MNPDYKYKGVKFFDLEGKLDPALEADNEPLDLELHPFYIKFWDELHMSSFEKSLKLSKHDKKLERQ